MHAAWISVGALIDSFDKAPTRADEMPMASKVVGNRLGGFGALGAAGRDALGLNAIRESPNRLSVSSSSSGAGRAANPACCTSSSPETSESSEPSSDPSSLPSPSCSPLVCGSSSSDALFSSKSSSESSILSLFLRCPSSCIRIRSSAVKARRLGPAMGAVEARRPRYRTADGRVRRRSYVRTLPTSIVHKNRHAPGRRAARTKGLRCVLPLKGSKTHAML